MTMKQFKNTHVCKMIKDLFETGECRPVVQYGCGKRTSYSDYTSEILSFINRDCIEIGNDAPRGGAMGKFIRLKV